MAGLHEAADGSSSFWILGLVSDDVVDVGILGAGFGAASAQHCKTGLDAARAGTRHALAGI